MTQEFWIKENTHVEQSLQFKVISLSVKLKQLILSKLWFKVRVSRKHKSWVYLSISNDFRLVFDVLVVLLQGF